MKTVEGLDEVIKMQQDKINNMDHKIDVLESALRYERNVNKMMMKFLKDKFGSEFIERVESNC